MKYKTCSYCHRNKIFNHTYGMCQDCLKEASKKYSLELCINCDGDGILCFCGNGLQKIEKELEK